MDLQKEKHNYLAMLVAEDAITQEQCSNLSLHNGGNCFHSDFLASSKVDCINWGWSAWLKAKAQAIPDGFVLVKKRNMIGNPNVDWSQAPKWAKYWLKDGHSNKYWWSSTRPVKDMDINAFCWKAVYFAKEAPDFSFSGPWDKSLTSRKAMIEAQEQSHD